MQPPEKSKLQDAASPGAMRDTGRAAFPHHIFWYIAHPEQVDLSTPASRVWYLSTVLREGRAEDIRRLDIREIEQLLPQLRLPVRVRQFWGWFFEERRRRAAATASAPGPGQGRGMREGMEPTAPRLTPLQCIVLVHLGGLADTRHFVLSGGTALAGFYLHHRRSDDLDFFTSTLPTMVPYSHTVEQTLRSGGLTTSAILRTESFVRMEVARADERLRVDLARDAPFRFQPPRQVVVDGVSLLVENLRDLAASKVLALFGRAEPRDFVDIYFLRRHYPLPTLVELATEKDPGFDLYWFCVALRQVNAVSLEGLELYQPLREEELRRWFTEETHRLCQSMVKA